MLLLLLTLGSCSEWGVKGAAPPEQANGVPISEDVWWLDTWTLEYQTEADILFIIDNSCSMAEEQALLAANFGAMMPFMTTSGVDYHIAVVTTDLSHPAEQGRLNEVGPFFQVAPGLTNPAGVFSALADVGTQGAPTERGRDAAWAAIELRNFPTYEKNAVWFRGDADQLHFVFVSDENDGSDMNHQEFIRWLWYRFPQDEKFVQAHAIVSELGDTCEYGFSAGLDYTDYAKETGGLELSLCDDWGEMLEMIGLQAAGLNPEIVLSRNPVVETIELTVDGVTIAVCDSNCPAIYRPGRNSVVLLGVPYTGGTVVQAYYQVNGAWE